MSLSEERLREIEERVARVEALRDTARDLLTAVNENNDTRRLHALLDDLVDLLNPPTEGEADHE